MHIEKWKSTRAKGKTHFILTRGVIQWGLSTAILWSIIMHFNQPSDPVWIRPLIALVIFPLGGIPFAYFVWWMSETKFKKLTEQPDKYIKAIEMFVEKWKSIRAKGKMHFIFKHGVINWGVSSAILWSIAMHFVQPIDPIWKRPLIALVIFPLSGILIGYSAWRASEARFKELTEQTQQSS